MYMKVLLAPLPLILLPPRQTPHDRGGGGEFLIDNLLVRIHLIIEMTLVDRPLEFPFPGSLLSSFLVLPLDRKVLLAPLPLVIFTARQTSHG